MNRILFFLIAAIAPFLAESQQIVSYPVPPIHHANGWLASSGNVRLPFYHDNGQIAWLGMSNSDPRVFHHNGRLAWKGYFPYECAFGYTCSSIFHNNGTIAWKGSSYNDPTLTNDPCSVFHDNGSVAWKGALHKDCIFFYDNCSAFFRNENLAWKGALYKNCYFSLEPCTIFHSNGRPAWKGAFVFENPNLQTSGLFHDNGVLAWTGRYGDPIYDRNGFITASTAEAINLPIGEGSWLYLSYNGLSNLHVEIGEESFLTFSNQELNPRLRVHLGTGLNLECFPYTRNMPQIMLYETPIPARESF